SAMTAWTSSLQYSQSTAPSLRAMKLSRLLATPKVRVRIRILPVVEPDGPDYPFDFHASAAGASTSAALPNRDEVVVVGQSVEQMPAGAPRRVGSAPGEGAPVAERLRARGQLVGRRRRGQDGLEGGAGEVGVRHLAELLVQPVVEARRHRQGELAVGQRQGLL